MSEFKPVPLIYTIGPMTATTSWEWEQNLRRAEEVGLKPLHVDNGLAVHCPQINGRFFRDNVTYEVALRADKSALRACNAALVLPGWQESKGSNEEIEFCDEQGIPLFFSVDELLDAYACGAIPETKIERVYS